MPKLWEQTGAALLTRVSAAGQAALVFWTWALAVYVASHGGWEAVTTIVGPLVADAATATLLAAAAAGAIAVVASSALVARLTTPVLRILEGYWRGLLAPAAQHGIGRWARKCKTLETAAIYSGQELRDGLSEKGEQPRRPKDPEAGTAAQLKLRHLPAHDELMPTRIGNIIRAGERRPAHWYGLDAVVVWPLLWLVLPAQVRADISRARTALDQTVAAFIWAVLSISLGIWWWPALIVGAVLAVLIWATWIPASAQTYAILIAATFDTHRFSLYTALHLPLPHTWHEELQSGKALSEHVWHGSNTDQTYAHPQPNSETE